MNHKKLLLLSCALLSAQRLLPAEAEAAQRLRTQLGTTHDLAMLQQCAKALSDLMPSLGHRERARSNTALLLAERRMANLRAAAQLVMFGDFDSRFEPDLEANLGSEEPARSAACDSLDDVQGAINAFVAQHDALAAEAATETDGETWETGDDLVPAAATSVPTALTYEETINKLKDRVKQAELGKVQSLAALAEARSLKAHEAAAKKASQDRIDALKVNVEIIAGLKTKTQKDETAAAQLAERLTKELQSATSRLEELRAILQKASADEAPLTAEVDARRNSLDGHTDREKELLALERNAKAKADSFDIISKYVWGH